MTRQEIHFLLVDYLSNTITEGDYDRLMDVVASSKNDSELYLFMEKIWDSQPVSQSFSDLQSEVLYKRILADTRFKDKPTAVIPISAQKLVYRWITVAAAVLLIASIGILWYTKKDVGISAQQDNQIAKISPGSNKAILILESGERIALTDLKNGEVLNQNGIKITKTSDGQLIYDVSNATVKNGGDKNEVSYNTIFTPAGGQFKVMLPDGTNVWLNASSSLKYPTNFNSFISRNVTLTGEGYFEVAPNKHKPFIVNSSGQLVKVLGTHFNINTYADEPNTVTTLFEGSVEVTAGENHKIIKPSQQTIVKGDMISVADADLEATLAWKNGYFIFNDEEIGSVMRKIARWYDVEVVFSEGAQIARTLEGATPRSKDLSEILRKFELLGDIHFKIQGRRVIVMP